MAKLDIKIPDDLDMKIQRLVDDGEFLDYEEAVHELISSGITAYRTDNIVDGDNEVDEFGDAGPVDHDDDYVF